MSAKVKLNIDNPIKIAFSAKDIEEAILSILVEKHLEGVFEVDLKFVSVQEIHKLNREFREIDKPTDVLSFPIHEKVDKNTPRPVLLGDIILCSELANDNIIDLIKHSTLHLLGFHHKED